MQLFQYYAPYYLVNLTSPVLRSAGGIPIPPPPPPPQIHQGMQGFECSTKYFRADYQVLAFLCSPAETFRRVAYNFRDFVLVVKQGNFHFICATPKHFWISLKFDF